MTVDKEELIHFMDRSKSKPPPAHPNHSLIESSTTFILPLPSLSQLDKEAHQLSVWEFESAQAQRRAELEEAAAAAGPVAQVKSPKKASELLQGVLRTGSSTSTRKAASSTFELYDVFKAIDARDVMKLMSIRDSPNGFNLLLQKPAGGAWPLVYAMRCGPRYSEVTIVLVGAFSRYINTLEGDDAPLTREQASIVKALRVNLKSAIDFGLKSQQTTLISSYLQVLVMSEGEGFILKSVQDLSLALRAGPPAAKPVAQARSAVQRFYTKDLKGEDKTLAAVEDYIANATADLILFALHDLLISPGEDPLPLYSFARDLRTLGNFVESVETMNLARKPPRFRRLAQLCTDLIGNTRHSFPTRISELEAAIDGDDGLK